MQRVVSLVMVLHWWFAGETCVKVAGRWTYPYRAVDQHGAG